MSAETPFDVIVIGGGLAGLATGALLANEHRRVLVLERRPVLGGRALVVQQEGFTLNYGLHYIVGGPASPHYRILKQIGKADKAPMAPVDPRKLYRMRGGKLHRVPTTPIDMLTTELLSPRGKLELVKAITLLMTVDAEKLWRVPIGEWLNGITREPTLRTFLLDLCGPLAFEPKTEELSAAHFILLVRPLLLPKGPLGYYPVGGWNTIFEAFKSHIEEHGGEVRTRAAADALEIANDQIVGVRSGGNLIKAPAVVLAIPPGEMVELLRDTQIAGLEPERLKNIRPTMGVAVDLGVLGLENDTVATIELPELGATLGIHNLFEPSLAPPGGHLFQFLRFLTPEQMQDKAEVDRSESILLGVMEQIWPSVSQKVVLRRTLIRPVMTAASHRYDQPRPTLLPIRVESIRGLFLAGDATASPGELSNAAGESALACARAILSP